MHSGLMYSYCSEPSQRYHRTVWLPCQAPHVHSLNLPRERPSQTRMFRQIHFLCGLQRNLSQPYRFLHLPPAGRVECLRKDCRSYPTVLLPQQTTFLLPPLQLKLSAGSHAVSTDILLVRQVRQIYRSLSDCNLLSLRRSGTYRMPLRHQVLSLRSVSSECIRLRL